MSVSHPIKRTPPLQPLSREHMSGLIQARNLTAAAAQPPEARRDALARFRAVWQDEIAAHFLDEERMLADLLSAPTLARLHTEHRVLRTLAQRAIAECEAASPDPELLRELGIALHDHIRWEERDAFGEAERAATPADLARLATDAAAIERHRPGSRPRLRL